MSGFSTTVKVDTRELDHAVQESVERMTSMMDVWPVVQEVVLTAVEDNFQEEGRPSRWQDLSQVTKDMRRGDGELGKILQDTGRLKNSITAEKKEGFYEKLTDDEMVVGTNLVYAAIHNFGGMAGRNHKVKIPQREFINLMDDDIDEVAETIEDWLRLPWSE